MTGAAGDILRLRTEELIERHGCERIDQYLSLLEIENQRHNLVSRETSGSERRRLAAESLVPLERLNPAIVKTYLDIGSGGGLPAFPLMLCRFFVVDASERSVLLDRSNKKTAALRRMAIGLGLKIDIEVTEIEQFTTDSYFDLITVRQVRITPTILKKAISLLNPGGTFAIYSDCTLQPTDANISQACFSYFIDSEDAPRSMTLFTRNR